MLDLDFSHTEKKSKLQIDNRRAMHTYALLLIRKYNLVLFFFVSSELQIVIQA